MCKIIIMATETNKQEELTSKIIHLDWWVCEGYCAISQTIFIVNRSMIEGDDQIKSNPCYVREGEFTCGLP